MHKKSISLMVSALIVLSWYSQVLAAAVKPIEVVDKVKSLLEDPLPQVSEVIPGDERPGREVPTLIVATLEGEKDDEMSWGDAIGRIIRRKITFAPRNLLRMPDLTLSHVDAWRPGMRDKDVYRSTESIKLLGKRLGITNALTGKVRIYKSMFELNLSLLLDFRQAAHIDLSSILKRVRSTKNLGNYLTRYLCGSRS